MIFSVKALSLEAQTRIQTSPETRPPSLLEVIQDQTRTQKNKPEHKDIPGTQKLIKISYN